LKAFALCLVGIGCLFLSLGITFRIIRLWVFSGFSEEGYVSMKAVKYWLYLSCISVFAGLAGGYLIGRYLRLKESSIGKK